MWWCFTSSYRPVEVASHPIGIVWLSQAIACYCVMSMPTLMVFSGGAAQKSLFGAIPKRKLIEELNQWLGESRV